MRLEGIIGEKAENLFSELDAIYEVKHAFRHQLVPRRTMKPIIKDMYKEIQKEYLNNDTLLFKKAYRQTVTINKLDPPMTVY